MIYCTACGLEISSGLSACPRCGAPVRTDLRASDVVGPDDVGRTVSRIHLRKTSDDTEQGESARPAEPWSLNSPEPAVPPTSPSRVPAAPWDPEPHHASVPSAPGTESPDGWPPVRPATLGDRFLARLADGILYLGLFIVVVVISSLAGALGLSPGLILLLDVVLYTAATAAIWTYEILGVGRAGQTVGRMILGVKVVDNITNTPVGPSRAFVRALVFVAMGIPCYLGYISFFLDSTGQFRAWHDKAAGDRVVRVPRRGMSEAVAEYRAAVLR